LNKRFAAVAAGAALAALCLTPAFAQSTMMKGHAMMQGGMAEHGMPPGGDGHTFKGQPDLAATISLVKAGGGPTHFSVAKALVAMVGPALTTAEVNKLTKQYGKTAVTNFITVQNFAVESAAATAMQAGVKFPNSNITGKALAARLVGLGVPGNSGAYYTGTMLDHLVTNKIHEATMDAIDAKYTPKLDANYHKVSNQAFYDLAKALGANVKLATFH
jgi:hypothetical protein